MTAKVRLLPGGREFYVEKKETILHAGLRAGLNLRYNCSNGSCGECKAKIVSGTPGTVLFHDYVLTEQEKEAGITLLCCTEADHDLVVEASEARSADDIPVQEIEVKITGLDRLNDEVMAVHFRTPRSRTLRFLAGQYLTLMLNGQEARNKSLASCPCDGLHLETHIHHVPGDPFSEYVFSQLRTGEKATVRGPWGSFTLDEESLRPMIFIAYETAFAPVKSLIEHSIALETEQPVQLFWIAARKDGHYMSNYCRSWADALDEFRFRPVLGKGESEREVFLSGLEEVLTENHNLHAFDIYLTAPLGVGDEAVQQLVQAGADQEHVKLDSLERI